MPTMNAPTDSQTPTFNPNRLFHIAAHGNMQAHRAAIHELTSFLPSYDWQTIPNPTTQAEELVRDTAASADNQSAPPSAADEPRAIHRYNIARSGAFNQTFVLTNPLPATSTITPSPTDPEALASFHVPVNWYATIPFTITPLPTIPSPQPINLKIASKITRSQSFTFNSASHTWVWPNSACVELVRETGGAGKTVLAKARMADKFYRSGGVVMIADGEGRSEDEREEWTRVVLVTLLGTWRREREAKYGFPSWKREENRGY